MSGNCNDSECQECVEARQAVRRDVVQPEREISSELAIYAYLHCAQCLREKPAHESPKDFARLAFGKTTVGFQLWCVRHDRNVLNIDLLNQKIAMSSS